ncbi:flagellar hook-associated protein FlgL [Psychromonas sp. CD1]|uniref:flagellar hook-associated protein FlgL n=1 Tax=Psychromonas sp. CD1 TaxID=1979839 RepID=UPI000B9AE53D|nr:flagellar hook-associated protein FlgL [Psychromonas sp. CD1]
MRISSQVFFQRNTKNMLTHQTQLSEKNIHLATQKRVINASDDAVAIATIQRLKQDVSVADQYVKNGGMAETANALESISLAQTTNILQRTRELMVTSGNETYNEEGREAIATELEHLREELVGVANTKDGNSQYIFSGFEVDIEPFQKNEFGTVEYHGDDGNRSYQIGSGVAIQGGDPGSAIFMQIPEGNGSFVAEANNHNSGSGVLDVASIIDTKVADKFQGLDYTISISDSIPKGTEKYSVYSTAKENVTGDASIKISKVDLTDVNIASVNPNSVYPDAGSDVDIDFVATLVPGEFEVRINNQSSLPNIYNANNNAHQEITINGISIEISGMPNNGDQYKITKYIEPTTYKEGQSIEFNGIKTKLKGEVNEFDSFSLRQSGTKDIFSTIQDAIDTLRIPGDADGPTAQREMRLDTVRHQIDNAMGNISTVVTSVGARRRTIENQHESTVDFQLSNKKTLSNLEDLDMASAISEFKLQMTSYQYSNRSNRSYRKRL